MELIVQVHDEAALAAALDAGVAGVAVRLPRDADSEWWSEIRIWQTAARRRACKFYLIWDHLIADADFPQALEVLGASAQLGPDALALRDPGLAREARLRHPHLVLHAAGSWGVQTSPGLKLAENLGFSRVALEAPISLKDLALLRRQSSLALQVELPPFCRGYAGLSLTEEYLGLECPRCGAPGQESPADLLMTALETLSGLCQLGVEAIQIRGDFFPGDSLGQVLGLFKAVWEAPASERPRVLTAARQVLAAFGDRFRLGEPQGEPAPEKQAAQAAARRPPPSPPKPVPGVPPHRGLLWLEARGYPEAAALAREWRDPIVVELTRENYAAFLPELRRWGPRRLIWRLPPALQESALSFYQKALETLRQGGYSRVVAGDWGAAVLARSAGCEVYGDQTLGVRNTPALEVAHQVGVARVCLPPAPRPEDWQKWLHAAPPGRFWSYLYHFPALAVCPRTGAAPPLPAPGLRWVTYGENVCLSKETPEHLEKTGEGLSRQGVAPLVVSLPRSRLPWGKVPDLAAPAPQRSPRRTPQRRK
jgi:collagenase-like PrtC family protease